MTLPAGAMLGPFEVLAPIGAGGMGEVYRARDTRLKREVALKVLPDAFAHDPERLARFQREAELLATLNHPNIAVVHGLEQADRISAIVLELVDGDTLADLIARGPLPIADALPIARQIADALEAAHEKGVVHRDLKPGNIKVTTDGRVKVLDFGLAKLLESDADPSALTMSPTLSVQATRAGIILGTAAYMSPEQARGKRVDRRTDIWAFGCVLFEMLTGKQAFDPGDTVSDAIVSVLTREPDWHALPNDIPGHLRTLLRRCLQKDPQKRLPHIGVARIEIDEGEVAPARTQGPAEAPRASRVWVAAAVGLLVAAIGLGLTALYFYRAIGEAPALQFSVLPPENTAFDSNPLGFIPLVSPDGRHLAFTARDATGIRIWVRALESLAARPLQGTEGASYPFWSPDSRSIAFFAQGQLKRIEIAGGPPLALGNATNGRGGAWNRDGVILFAAAATGPLYRVAAGGGEPVAVTTPTGSGSHRFPSFLPDGRRFLYGSLEEPGSIEVRVGSLDSTDSTRLFVADSTAIYSTSGELLFVRQGTLLRQRLDVRTLELRGDPTPVAESVAVGPNLGAFSVSDTGLLAYRTGLGSTGEVQLAWFDRTGKLIETVGTPAPLRGVDLSPDGRRVAVHRHDGNGGDVWLLDLARRGTMTRLTFDTAQENASPIWAPDGRRIVFGSRRNGRWGLYEKAADGTRAEQLLVESDLQNMPMAWAPDGTLLAYWVAHPKTAGDQWILPLGGDRKPFPLLQTIFNETHAQISPNGRWIAYQSNESGRAEIYVRPFPTGEGKWQISSAGGFWTRWRADGTELFYMTNASLGKLMSVKVNQGGPSFEYGDSAELFDSGYVNFQHFLGGAYHTYAVSPDGQRFLIPRPEGAVNVDAAPAPITVVVNWTRALAR